MVPDVLRPGMIGTSTTAAIALHDVGADDLFDRIVRAFHEDIGPKRLDEGERRVFGEDDDRIDRGERGKHGGAVALVVDQDAPRPSAVARRHRC